jgi:DNA-binding MarR family transcriptional regulator
MYYSYVKKAQLKQTEDIRQESLTKYLNKTKRVSHTRSFYWLLRFTDALYRFTDLQLGREGDSRTGMAVLQVLLKYPDGMPQKDIAEQTGRSKQAIVVAIDSLAERGHVIRYADKKDRRMNSIKITQKGINHLAEVFPRTVQISKEALSSLSDEEIGQLLSIAKKLTNDLWDRINIITAKS